VAQSGNNSIVIGENMTVPTCVWAGTGNDLLSTGANNDDLRAGAGNDTIVALGTGDKLYAGTGYTNMWSDTLNTYWKSTGTLVTHFFSSFLNTGDMSLDGQSIAEPGTNTQTTFEGTWKNFSNNPLFSSAGPQLEDINQGACGDCYFMSALGAIANVNPQQIRNNITPLGDGTYAEEFYENGAPVFVRVDGQLAVEDNSVFYANTSDTTLTGSIWAPLMEKGWAYVDSIEKGDTPDYGVIDTGGFADPTFDALTGNTAVGTDNVQEDYDSLSMFNNNENYFANWVSSELNSGNAVEMAFSNGNSKDEYCIPNVLVNDHMYTVISATTNSSGAIIGFWVHNPWGFDVQNTTTYAKQMAASGHNDGKDDGKVWITVAEAWSMLDDVGAVSV
jgi:hypothetical protein